MFIMCQSLISLVKLVQLLQEITIILERTRAYVLLDLQQCLVLMLLLTAVSVSSCVTLCSMVQPSL